MKYLITESKMNSLIEDFLKKQFDVVVDVKFKKIRVHLASTHETIDRTEIQILIDPYEILKGNFDYDTSKGIYIIDVIRDISKTLDNLFTLNYMKYGSKWSIEYFVLRTSKQ
jgi:ATP-dependent protease HslVU (ClpYQ) ATPase subunit